MPPDQRAIISASSALTLAGASATARARALLELGSVLLANARSKGWGADVWHPPPPPPPPEEGQEEAPPPPKSPDPKKGKGGDPKATKGGDPKGPPKTAESRAETADGSAGEEAPAIAGPGSEGAALGGKGLAEFKSQPAPGHVTAPCPPRTTPYRLTPYHPRVPDPAPSPDPLSPACGRVTAA